MSLNKQIDKAQVEAESLKNKGFKEYLFTRKTSMSLGVFLISLGAAFVLGAILF
jgi:hypothetical protein